MWTSIQNWFKRLFANIWYYMPSVRSLWGVTFYVLGYLLDAVDNMFGTTLSAYYTVFARFVAMIVAGFSWLLDYICHASIILTLAALWFDLFSIMLLIRLALLVKSHLWQSGR